MPSKDRTLRLYKALLEAALDQPKPTKQLAAAAQSLLFAIEHPDRLSSSPKELIILDEETPFDQGLVNEILSYSGF